MENATVGTKVYPEPLLVRVTVLTPPSVSRVAVAVAFWNGSVVTSTACCPPTYPEPAATIFTLPIPFLRTTKAEPAHRDPAAIGRRAELREHPGW